ncbi:hypothetical protein CTAYLR_007907 [Chrysophaeum taylorii]|uniref:DUF202 domain-containing protein n=1 Tax=Chrysophaeum taylorii TaxID=2483200 RepID=A0AAD7XMD2_9STRA|nr:hypothetical protein CTAYLR_007907 [Chrysophaeum taylorii]
MAALGLFSRSDEREPLTLRVGNVDVESSLRPRRYEMCPSSVPPVAISNADKPRKLPVKVDPKVFFANERTFLAWIHMALILGGIGVGIISFADRAGWSAIYGFVLLPVAVAFIVYALRQFYVRAHAIRAREPGPYEDRMGPYALGITLIMATVTNVIIHAVIT